jgi:hypothetical protein
MRSPDRRGVHCHELHRALKRVSSTATAAKVFDISTQCVGIFTEPYRFCHKIFARPSDTIGALKDKMMRSAGVSGWSHVLRFESWRGVELQNECSLSQCGNYCIEVTVGSRW